MCPDPFNDVIDMMGFSVWFTFLITFLMSWYQEPAASLGYLILLCGWTSLIILCYIFAPRHAVSIGIPFSYQSRYERWKTGRSNWDSRTIDSRFYEERN
jgi:hypothetical protein